MKNGKIPNESEREFLQKRGIVFLDDLESELIANCYFLTPKLEYLFIKDYAKKHNIDSVSLYEILREVSLE